MAWLPTPYVLQGLAISQQQEMLVEGRESNFVQSWVRKILCSLLHGWVLLWQERVSTAQPALHHSSQAECQWGGWPKGLHLKSGGAQSTPSTPPRSGHDWWSVGSQGNLTCYFGVQWGAPITNTPTLMVNENPQEKAFTMVVSEEPQWFTHLHWWQVPPI